MRVREGGAHGTSGDEIGQQDMAAGDTTVDVGRHRQRTETFRLVYVCTGNICRSPVAEIMTRHLLIGKLGGRLASRFDVSSAGVSAVVDSQIHPDTREELTPWGLDGVIAGRFRARQLRSAMVREADLVLGANPRHRSAVVEQAPEGMKTAFSIREFALLAEAVDPDVLPLDPITRAHELVEQARLNRGLVPIDPEELEIPDPMGRSQKAHHEAVMLIVDAVARIVNLMVPTRR
ncbi:MAG: low molecular weight protein-tyrosine phosphatase [Pseudonocardiales bacterium]|nr:low molecular weight protein-tyrosine phosphatase [Pseudonocardiales bacterium]